MWGITLLTRIKSAVHTIRFKLLFAYLLIVIIAFTAISAAMIRLVGEYVFARSGDEYLRRVEGAAGQAQEAQLAGESRRLYSVVTGLADEGTGRAAVLDENGTVICDSASELNGHALSVQALLPELGEADGCFRVLKTALLDSFDLNGQSRVFLCAVNISGGTLIAAYPAGDVTYSLSQLWKQLATVMLAVAAVTLLLGILLTRRFTKRVTVIKSAIGQLSKGDFTVRVQDEGKDELGDLSRAFNDMTRRMELLDRSRNQFVSNASHELRTPLTTIKVMVESVMLQQTPDPKMTQEFLGDACKEVDRMTAIVSDLLTLVGMDSGETKLNLEEVDLNALVATEAHRLQPKARERGIELEMINGDKVEMQGDPIKLGQVFYNLIDNAVKYTPRGEHVRVEVARKNGQGYVYVRDNGIGIPKEDCEHIFDRFYRVDKARSRETGGTGLGLSIVKQIVLAHGGNIEVDSRENVGSTFTVSLPLNTKAPGGRNG